LGLTGGLASVALAQFFCYNDEMYLFITSTTYAQWLPGDKRGFVSRVDAEIHNEYGTPMSDDDVAPDDRKTRSCVSSSIVKVKIELGKPNCMM
jgi:hypothetical protein